jgi:hypothetical protein
MNCSRCGGSGELPQFWHVQRGICYRCNGRGEDPKLSKIVKALQGEQARANKMGKDSLVDFYQQLINQVGRQGEDMCGTLRLEGMHKRVGDKVAVLGPKGEGHAMLSGFAQVSSLSWWNQKGEATRVKVKAESFVEGQVTLRVPTKEIEAIGLKKDAYTKKNTKWVVVGPRHTVRILTRAPLNPFEKALHNRWPLVLDEKGKKYQWTHEDILSGQGEFPF